MKIKDKLLNKVADMLSNYRTPKYDTILSLGVRGQVKGVLTTYDCTYTKELKDKEKDGFISVDKLLNEEIGDIVIYIFVKMIKLYVFIIILKIVM